jgi:hypothetical protein
MQRVDIATESLNSTGSHTLTIEVVSGWGQGVYVQSCSINGAPLPAAIIPHDVLQVMLATCHVLRCVKSDTSYCSRLPPGPYRTRLLCTSASMRTISQTVADSAIPLTFFWNVLRGCDCGIAVLRSNGSLLQFALADAPQAWSSHVDWDAVLNLWQLY